MNFEQVCHLLRIIYPDSMEEQGGNQFVHQRDVIGRAWQSLVENKRNGIVLADEVGMGKTYEALGVTYFYLLHRLSSFPQKQFRVLIHVMFSGADCAE